MAWAGNESAYNDFITRHNLTFPQISDSTGDIYARFSINSQPALIIITPDGATQTFLGPVDETSLDAALTSATKA